MIRLPSLKFFVLVCFILTSCVTLYAFLSSHQQFHNNPKPLHEKFDENLLQINNCNLLDYVIMDKFKKSGYDTAETVLFIDHLLRERFYHSYSQLSFHDNWIANVCGKLIWRDFLFPVIPCDIIRYPMGACSQQGIIFQDQLNKLKIPCSTIEFYPVSRKKPGHFAVSVYYDSSWHFFDSNQEPLIVDRSMPNVATIISKKLYEKMYVSPNNKRFQEFFKNKSYNRVKKEPFAKGNMYYFQTLSSFLSAWLWLIFLVLFLVLWSYPKNRK